MTAQLEWPLQFKRQYAAPIDADMVFETETLLNDYLTNPLRYAGQMATCLERPETLFIMNVGLDKWDTIEDGANFEEAVLTEPVTSMFDIGNIPNGYTLTEGKTFTEFIKRLFRAIHPPTYVAPAVGLAANLPAAVEAGHQLDLELTATYNTGAIMGIWNGEVWEFDQKQADRAGEATKYLFDGVDEGTNASKTLAAHQLDDGANSYTVVVEHAEGPQPVDSNGADFEAPLPVGTVTATRTIHGRRKLFFGTDSATSDSYTTSAQVRSMTADLLHPSNGLTFDINIPIGARQVTFAYPATLRVVTSVQYIEGMNVEVKSNFIETALDVEGANGYTAVGYRLYTYKPVTPFIQNVTYRVTI